MAMAMDKTSAAAGQARSGSRSGFVLLEVMVAFLIVALAVGVLYHAILTGLREAQIASRYEQALSRARSRLALAEGSDTLVSGDHQGDDGSGFGWRLRVTPIDSTMVRPFGPAGLRPAAGVPVTLYAVSIWVSWRDFSQRRSVRLDTELLGQASP
jgi:general secretion pathway protein I